MYQLFLAPHAQTMNGERYSDLVREVVGHGASCCGGLPCRKVLLQVNPAKIHHYAAALAASADTFSQCVPTDNLTLKIADFWWLIKNVQSMLEDAVLAAEPKNVEALKRVIFKKWGVIEK